MAPLDGLVNAVATLGTVVLVVRAIYLVLEAPDEAHRDLVPTWERRLTTAVGVPALLVGLSTMVGGPLAVPYNPLSLALFGAAALVYPDFSPSPL